MRRFIQDVEWQQMIPDNNTRLEDIFDICKHYSHIAMYMCLTLSFTLSSITACTVLDIFHPVHTHCTLLYLRKYYEHSPWCNKVKCKLDKYM